MLKATPECSEHTTGVNVTCAAPCLMHAVVDMLSRGANSEQSPHGVHSSEPCAWQPGRLLQAASLLARMQWVLEVSGGRWAGALMSTTSAVVHVPLQSVSDLMPICRWCWR